MAKTKGISPVEQAQTILERVRNAESTKDFDLLSSNLAAIKSFLEQYKDRSGRVIIPGDTGDAIKNQISVCLRRLNASISLEQNRRTEINTLGKDYDVAKKKLEEYDTQRALYEDLLANPAAKKFKYPRPPFDIDSLPVEQGALVDYFNSMATTLGISQADLAGKGIAFIEKEIARIEKEMDKLAFDINKANGVYDEKVAKGDFARARELEGKKQKAKDYGDAKTDLKTKHSRIYDAIFGNPTATPPIPAGGPAEIERQLASIRDKRNPLRQQLITLRNEVKFSGPEDKELKALYKKYDITSLAELEAIANGRVAPAQAQQAPSASLSPRALKQRVDHTGLTKTNPQSRLLVANVSTQDKTGTDIAEFTRYLQQEKGYTPTVGRESYVYARPIYKKGLFGRETKKLQGMEVVEQSIESIAKEPVKAYREALKEASKKCRSMGIGRLSGAQRKKMVAAFEELIAAGINSPDGPQYMNEAIKRIIAVQASNSRESLGDLIAPTSFHLNATKDTDLTRTPISPENYDAPKITARRVPVISDIIKTAMRAAKIETETPAYTPTTPAQSQYLKYTPGNRGRAPVVSRDVVKDRTHHKDDDRDEI